MTKNRVSGAVELTLIAVAVWLMSRWEPTREVLPVVVALLLAGAVTAVVGPRWRRSRRGSDSGSTVVRLIEVGPQPIQVVKVLREVGVENWRSFLEGTAPLPADVAHGWHEKHALAVVERLVGFGAEAEISH